MGQSQCQTVGAASGRDNGQKTQTFFHYTTEEAAQNIARSGVILKSSRYDDAAFGSGVYFTKIPPSRPQHEIALNNYDGSASFAAMKMARGEHCLMTQFTT